MRLTKSLLVSDDLTDSGTSTWSLTDANDEPEDDKAEAEEAEAEAELLWSMDGRDWRSGVRQDNPVAVTAASMGSASPKTHLYLAPIGNSGSVRIVSCTFVKINK